MNETYFKTNITKLIFALLLTSSVFAANISLAHASLEPLMFSEDANIVKFTRKLIYTDLYSQRESSFDKSKDNKKDTRKFWIRVTTIVKHFERTY